MFCDYHVHTEFSDDSTYKMEDVIKDAIQLGMREICITDHVDYGVKIDVDQPNEGNKEFNVDYYRYFSELKRLKEKYRHQIVIKEGLEFGVQSHTIDQFNKLYNNFHLDFVILSIHQVDNKEFWTREFQNQSTQEEYYTAYFNEMYNVVQNFQNYSVLGHMDMLKRYDEKNGYDVFNQHKEMITQILKCVIENGKGIELNTSSIKYQLDDLMPSTDILKLYLELGGKIITIGSDSHRKEDLGSHIKELRKVLKDIGYTEFTTFYNMKPIFYNI